MSERVWLSLLSGFLGVGVITVFRAVLDMGPLGLTLGLLALLYGCSVFGAPFWDRKPPPSGGRGTPVP